MRRHFFYLINTLNKAILPRYSHLDPAQLNKFQQAVLAFRYYVLLRSKD